LFIEQMGTQKIYIFKVFSNYTSFMTTSALRNPQMLKRSSARAIARSKAVAVGKLR